jgi:competence protein ComEA
MKQWITFLALAIFTLGMPVSGYSQDTKAKAENKAKQDTKTAPNVKGKTADKGKAPDEIIDINTAAAAQLMTLDDIGDARAAAIIKGRPYKAKNQLVSRNILPEAAYDKIKEKLIARQAPVKK